MDNVLTISNLKTHFFLDEGTVRAVDGVTMDIPPGKDGGYCGGEWVWEERDGFFGIAPGVLARADCGG